MKKANYVLLSIFLGLLVSGTMTACAPPETAPPNAPPVEVVGSVPEELTHWLHSQLGLMKNPIIISQEHEGQIYILVTMGSQSRDQGQLTVTKESDQGEIHSLEITYQYFEGAGDSLDTHFLILKTLAGEKIRINLIDGLTQSDLAGFSYL
jgi:hypothetical protein